ncbi:uncharacterized protein LOC135710830 [Ochlerotatus camptorhynchus]|uniref:uncharacterized protein LOC135710830 n=1 Tax=Ochlerotatus camptorhynchus TaxID=644619 RepID=UPI0031E14DFE
MYISIKFLLILLVLETCSGNYTEYESSDHERVKRWLSFNPYGGLAKITLGIVTPVAFNHYKLVRNIVNTLNLQANYAIPSSTIWPVPESYFKNRLNNELVDNSRWQLYQLLENMFDSDETSGRDCVLRAICEVAESPLGHNGMIGDILDVVFTPYSTDQIDETYKEARLHGLNGNSSRIEIVM